MLINAKGLNLRFERLFEQVATPVRGLYFKTIVGTLNPNVGQNLVRPKDHSGLTVLKKVEDTL